MSLSGLEPETYGLKVVPSVPSQTQLNDVATTVCENDHLPGIAAAQRNAQRFPASTASADRGEDADLVRIIAAWPHLSDEVQAAVLAMIEAAKG